MESQRSTPAPKAYELDDVASGMVGTDADAVLKRHQDALKIHREVGDARGEAAALGNIGLILLAGGELEAALEHLEDALDILNSFGLTHGREIIQNAVAAIRAKQRT